MKMFTAFARCLTPAALADLDARAEDFDPGRLICSSARTAR
jgi:hypothetical protein